MKTLIVLVLAFSLTGCIPAMGLFNLATNDTQCEARNSDIERGAMTGTIQVCKPPTFDWQVQTVKEEEKK